MLCPSLSVPRPLATCCTPIPSAALNCTPIDTTVCAPTGIHAALPRCCRDPSCEIWSWGYRGAQKAEGSQCWIGACDSPHHLRPVSNDSWVGGSRPVGPSPSPSPPPPPVPVSISTPPAMFGRVPSHPSLGGKENGGVVVDLGSLVSSSFRTLWSCSFPGAGPGRGRAGLRRFPLGTGGRPP